MKRRVLKWIARKGWFKPLYVYCDYSEFRNEMVRYRVRNHISAYFKALFWTEKHSCGQAWVSNKADSNFDRHVKISHYTHKIFFR